MSKDPEDRLMKDFAAIVALRAAFAGGLLDVDGAARRQAAAGTRSGALLLHLLRQCGVLDESDSITPEVAELLSRRGTALRERVDFAARAAADCLRHAETLFAAPERFMAQADTFDFFRYGRAGSTKAADLDATEPWVRYVTALTEAEGPALARVMPLDGVTALTEIGGNSGAFAANLTAIWEELLVTVLDLPAVAHLGRRYIAGRGARRVEFVAGDARDGGWPEGEAVCFKSVLHDWSDDEARTFLRRAAATVPTGGRVIVVERGPIEDEALAPGISLAPNLVFGRFYRRPSVYVDWMREVGLDVQPRREVRLDMTHHIVWAIRK